MCEDERMNKRDREKLARDRQAGKADPKTCTHPYRTSDLKTGLATNKCLWCGKICR